MHWARDSHEEGGRVATYLLPALGVMKIMPLDFASLYLHPPLPSAIGDNSLEDSRSVSQSLP